MVDREWLQRGQKPLLIASMSLETSGNEVYATQLSNPLTSVVLSL